MPLHNRRAPRIEVLGQLHGHIVSIDTPVTVREVSLGGLSFASSIPFPPEAVHEFRLTLGDGSAVLLRGRIVWCQERATEDGERVHVCGVQFVDEEPPAHTATMGDLINKIS